MSPPEPTCYLAFDLGASMSRAVLGTLAGNVLELNVLHRFATPILEIEGHLLWDLDVLREELQTGFEKAIGLAPRLRSLSVDSWGVDYVTLDASDSPVRNPFCYRDPRTEGVMERAFSKMTPAEIYDITGIQFLPFNTLYQVLADGDPYTDRVTYGGGVDAKQRARDRITTNLPIADYFNFLFSGRRVIEVSMASTTQMMDVGDRSWSSALMERFGLDAARWPEIIPSGTRLGPVLRGTAAHGPISHGPASPSPPVMVIATCSHDTGSAVAAAPAVHRGENWAFISCGTWSLMGVERRSPLLSEAARDAGFTNEAGLDGTIRLLKNLTGLWVLQECVREWRSSGTVEWSDLEKEARTALRMGARTGGATRSDPAGGASRSDRSCGATRSDSARSAAALIDLENGRFLARGGMEERILAYCQELGLSVPGTRGKVVLTILSSIARGYGRTLSELERITGAKTDRIYLFGGGSQNALLCQLTADACRTEIVAGPVEATAMGNLLIQARTMGDLPAERSIRDIVAESSHLTAYFPNPD